ncbi:MAG: DUF6515 family protein [Candidatus Omnitrophica bacterium]|nr:DUF6515 family protein [Candidatus Omnitrophota bacterium]
MFPKRKSIIVLTALALTVFLHADLGEARIFRRRYPHRRHHYRPHPLWGRIVRIPRKLIHIIVGGRDYYYDRGVFYLKDTGGQYIVVAPPIGGILIELPPKHKRILVNGHIYYYYNDVYYAKHKKGYIVVDDPVYAVESLPEKVMVVAASDPTTVPDAGRYTVHIPHQDGTYVPVELIRRGDGYIGPQGEYYHDFPSIDQLQAMYAK